MILEKSITQIFFFLKFDHIDQIIRTVRSEIMNTSALLNVSGAGIRCLRPSVGSGVNYLFKNLLVLLSLLISLSSVPFFPRKDLMSLSSYQLSEGIRSPPTSG